MKSEWFKIKDKQPKKDERVIWYYPSGHVSHGSIIMEFAKCNLTGENLNSALWTYPPDIGE